MKKEFIFIAVLLMAVCAYGQQPSAAVQKFALVIGNGNYTGISRLNNPVNDANDMAAALQGLGFTVDKILNGNLDQMEASIMQMARRLGASANAYGFFYYAGHGVQSGGDNYLIPVDASNIQSEHHLRQRAVSVQAMLDNFNDSGNTLNVIVLDACRDNPFSWNRSGSRGLTIVGKPPADSIIVYATSAGSVAADGTSRNGLFTSHLLHNLKTPGLEVQEMFRRTMGDVARASGNIQRPEYRSQFYETAYLGAPPAAAQAQAQPAAPAQQQRSAPANFVRVEGGSFQMGSHIGYYDDQRPVRTVKIRSFYMGKTEVTQREWFEVMGTTVRQQLAILKSEYLTLAGESDNHPMYCVSWYEAIEYCNKKSIKEGLTPAYDKKGTTVTWNRNASGYRLPTEAEWEYAAKGGIGSPGNYTYAGSNDINAVAWYSAYDKDWKPIGERTTMLVGTKAPNGLGLYDMSGNVFEWCWDWYAPSYSNAGGNDNPTGAPSGKDRAVRGGAWSHGESAASTVMRSSYDTFYPDYRFNDVGFRVVLPVF